MFYSNYDKIWPLLTWEIIINIICVVYGTIQKQERKLISLTLLTIVQSFSEIRSVSWTQLGFSRVWSEIGFLDSLSRSDYTNTKNVLWVPEYQH